MIFARFLPNSAFLIKKSCSKLFTWWGGGGRGGGVVPLVQVVLGDF